MLPHWRGSAIEINMTLPTPQTQQQQQQQHKQQQLTLETPLPPLRPPLESDSNFSTSRSSSPDSCITMTTAGCSFSRYCTTNDAQTSESLSADTESDMQWLEEDRLQRTPTEQRMLEEQQVTEQSIQAARLINLELSSFPTLCDMLSYDSTGGGGGGRGDSQSSRRQRRERRRQQGGGGGSDNNNANQPKQPQSPQPVELRGAWRSSALTMGGVACSLLSMTAPPPPMPLSADLRAATMAANCGRACSQQVQANNSNIAAAAASAAAAAAAAVAAGGTNNSGSGNQAVASGRSLQDIEAAVQLTRNNSNQQQRYEMRGGHIVEICSRVEFPDRGTRNVSVTVEATHSNGCHRVIMLKGLTAKKRPDLGPKVKDCRLRMDQIVMTRPSTATPDWLKTITMSYDSDFQVGVGEEKTRAL